jgi:DNA-binding CsgD family transcriptional regulator
LILHPDDKTKGYDALLAMEEFIQYGHNTSPDEKAVETFGSTCRRFYITRREIDIIHLLAKEYTYQMIADELFISQKTVKKHISNLYRKTEVKKKAELLKKLNYVTSL